MAFDSDFRGGVNVAAGDVDGDGKTDIVVGSGPNNGGLVRAFHADGTQFVVEGELPLERYPALGFAVLLGPGEYLLIGWPADQPGTLGAAMFAVEAAGRPRQRVLVIRGGRPDPTPDDLPAVTTPARRPSIAAEASRPVGR